MTELEKLREENRIMKEALEKVATNGCQHVLEVCECLPACERIAIEALSQVSDESNTSQECVKAREWWIQNPSVRNIITATSAPVFDPEVNPTITEEVHVREVIPGQDERAETARKCLEILRGPEVQARYGHTNNCGGLGEFLESKLKELGILK